MLIMMINLLRKRPYLKTSGKQQQPHGKLLILSFTKKLMALPWEAQHLQP